MEDITNIFNSPVSSTVSLSSAPSPFKSPSSHIKARRANRLNQRKQTFIPHHNKLIRLDQLSHHSDESFDSIAKHKSTASSLGLHNKKSKLDMLDNSQLTSFPLAPPPSLEPKPQKVTEILRSPEINAQECFDDANETRDSDSMEADPIVLVEDYIQTKQLKRKKLSVADLKLSLEKFDTTDDSMNIEHSDSPSYLHRVKSILNNTSTSLRESSYSSSSNTNSTLLTNCIVEEEDEDINFGSLSTEFFSAKTVPSFFSSANSEHTFTSTSQATLKLSEPIFDRPIAQFSLNKSKSSLKYCIICETPLYELSSHLTLGQNFNEFVCSSCTDRYEMLSRLLDNFDESIADLQPIREDIIDIEEALSQPALKRQKNSPDSFSFTLINRLHSQLDGGPSNWKLMQHKDSALWLLEAKRKLRWRWRISGLLPKFLSNNNDNIKG